MAKNAMTATCLVLTAALRAAPLKRVAWLCWTWMAFQGYYCTQMAPSVCSAQCGDGRRVVMREECDDGNTISGDWE